MKAPIVWSAALLPLVLPAAAQAQSSYYGHPMWGGGWHGWFLGPLMMILFIAVAVAVVVLIVRWLGSPPHGGTGHQAPPAQTPLDILKERFARGEIDKEEYEERRRVLEE